MIVRLTLVHQHWTVYKDVEVSAVPQLGMYVTLDDMCLPVLNTLLCVGKTPDYHVELQACEDDDEDVKELLAAGWTLDEETPYPDETQDGGPIHADSAVCRASDYFG